MSTTSAPVARARVSRSRSAAVGVSTTSTPAGAPTARFAASSVTFAPRRLASAASATPMRPDERLPRKRTASSGSRVPPAVTRTARRRAHAGGPSTASTARAISSGSVIRPEAGLALGELALRRADDLHAARAQHLDVRLRRRVLPHAGVHRRRDEERPAVGERRLGEHVVGEPVRELRERVRRQRRDHERVGARQVRIEIVRRRPARERVEGLGGDEALGAGRDERQHVVPRPYEQRAGARTPCRRRCHR